MMRSALFLLALLLVAPTATGQDTEPAKPTPEQLTFFEKQIRPLFARHCYECHSKDAKSLKGGLQLDLRSAAFKGGDSGSSIKPGDVDGSLLIKSVRYLSYEMPPSGKLSDEQIGLLEKWVAMGAPWPEDQVTSLPAEIASYDWPSLQQGHWSFRPVTRAPAPEVSNQNWPQTTLDHFILARLEAAGLQPSEAADRRTLIRRAYLDLTGLPPSPQQVASFLADDRPAAFPRLVEQLLASPQYGEHWGRHWLDVARYSDGLGGFLDNAHLPHAWQYRDWVVRQWNSDLPYDQFVRSQLAGDLLDDWQAQPGTGFLALGPTYRSDGGDPDSVAQAKSETLDDRVDTITRGLLGLTVSCARCHDHKFDPIPTLDYYSLAGIFNNTSEGVHPFGTPGLVQRKIQYDAGMQAANNARKQIQDKLKAEKREPSDVEKARLAELDEQRRQLQESAPGGLPVVHAVRDSGNKDMTVALRGNLRKPGAVAPRRFLRIVDGAEPLAYQRGSGRLDLADSITSADNPLTTRVIVNRIWQWHFGTGLVATPSNFGTLGEAPSHPLLLDWLASEFVQQGWSIKQLHRTIMLSATYQMSSAYDERGFKYDGDNRLLWRFSPRRLTVESWRDSLLLASGELATVIGGPPTDHLLTDQRRTIYTVISRNGDRYASDEFLRLFDFPAPRATMAKRVTSTVPQQFLFMLNSSFMVQRAEQFAQRLERQFDNDADRIQGAYQILYGRQPTSDEQGLGMAFLGREQLQPTPAAEKTPTADADLLIADFEGPGYGNWKTTGEAFGPGPAQGTLPGQMVVNGFRGRGLVNSFFKGDGTLGTLTSPEIKIDRKQIHFLVGGGKYPGVTCINLIVDGQVVRTATGPNDRGGGSEQLAWASWDVIELAGKRAIIQIVDQRNGGWGHINVDHIYQSDRPIDGANQPANEPAQLASSKLTRLQQYAQVLLSSNEFMFLR